MPFSRSVPPKKKRVTLVVSGALLSLFAVVAVVALSAARMQPTVHDISFSQLRELSEAGSAQKVSVSGEIVTLTQADGAVVQSVVTNAVAQHEVVAAFEKAHVPVSFETQQPGVLVTALNSLLPATALAIFALIGWRVYASMGMQSESNASEAGPAQPVTFQDVAGVGEAPAQLAETIEFLRDPEKFNRLGGRAPRGILLSGPPGTGKTLLARAAATEAKVPFLSVSGSSFQEKFAGLCASRLRRLFGRARKLAPCVIFIDEIDALGRRRGRGGDSASADQDQTLNQLLVEMDGFEQLSGVVVIASTNRPDILDSALTRPGRFDREITVTLADRRGREQILRVHSRKLKLEDGLDLGWIARGTPGFSGADLANLLNEAAIAATRDG